MAPVPKKSASKRNGRRRFTARVSLRLKASVDGNMALMLVMVHVVMEVVVDVVRVRSGASLRLHRRVVSG